MFNGMIKKKIREWWIKLSSLVIMLLFLSIIGVYLLTR